MMMCEDIYEKNLSALGKRYPQLKDWIEKKRWQQDTGVNVITEESADAQRIFRVRKDERTLYLNGKREAVRPAKRWVKSLGVVSEFACICMFGIGNGVYLRECIMATKETVNILVYEPSLTIFFELLHHIDISDLIENRPIGFVVKGLNDSELKQILDSLIRFENLEFIKEFLYPNYKELFMEDALEFYRSLRHKIGTVMSEWNTRVMFADVVGSNLMHNMVYLLDGYKTRQMLDVLPRDIPAIIVAAGPSLNKNIHELKKAEGRAFIIAVDSAAGALTEAGIHPDIFVTIDGKKKIDLNRLEGVRNIPLVAPLTADARILDYHEGIKIFYSEGVPIVNDLFQKTGLTFEPVQCGGSVATAGFSLAYMLGYDTIILAGQDLALTGNQTHVKGTGGETGEEVDTSHLQMVEGNYEEKVPTLSNLKIYLEWYNNYISIIQTNHNVRVINATEGGAKIKGTELMTLAEAIEASCDKEVDISSCLNRLTPLFNQEQREKAVNYLFELPQQFKQLKADCKKGKSLYRRLNNLCRSGYIQREQYLKLLKKIRNFTKNLEYNPMFFMASRTLSLAEYIITSQKFSVEDDLADEGQEIARQGIKYLELVQECCDTYQLILEESLKNIRLDGEKRYAES